MQTNSETIQTNPGVTPAISPTPSQKTVSSEWLCDERWKGSNYIFVGIVKEIKPPENLTSEKKLELKQRLSNYNVKNLVNFQIEKIYKSSEKETELEILNLQTSDLPAIDFKIGEKYLLYPDAVTINKNEILAYYIRPDSQTKIYSESAEIISFLEENFKRKPFEEIFGDPGKDVILGGLVGGKAINLAKPKYPEDAKKEKASEAVSVYVLVDEQGQVVKARAVCAKYASLAKAAEEAALKSRYSPTIFKGKRVKVRGVVVYNFVP